MIFSVSVIALVIQTISAGIIPNGGFEDGLAGWGELWTREAGVGKLALDDEIRHSGDKSACVEHTGQGDWSFDPDVTISVRPGDIFQFSAWLKLEGSGSVTLCVVTYDAAGKVLQWTFAGRSRRAGDWGTA